MTCSDHRRFPASLLDLTLPGAPRRTLFIVDDDEHLLATLARLFEREGYAVQTFGSPLTFLSTAVIRPPACLLLDIDMPEMSGVELQAALARIAQPVPIVFMTGHDDDVRLSVQAMKAGAVDYLLKPFENAEALEAVATALRRSEALEAHRVRARDAEARLARLTGREREVCLLVAEGNTSKAIADRLGTSERTITTHRSRIMTKLGVDSVAEVVQLVGLLKPAPGD